MTVAEKALQWAIGLANDQSHGYSQQNRWGPDYDCSSLAIESYRKAGVPIDLNQVCYTGNMQQLTKFGFKDVTSSVNLNTGAGLQPGDILYYHISGTNGHTALYAGNGQIVHARGQSYGSSKTGDQGTEIAVTAYSRSKWQHVLRYGGGAAASSGSGAAATPAAPAIKRYAVSTQMPIIKKGSIGRAAKVWQTIIGVNADDENLKASAAFLASLPTKPEVVNLLVYHDVGIGKHARLGTEYNPAALHMEAPSEEVQQHALDIMRQYGLNTKIGG
jgi:hypothetical protein